MALKPEQYDAIKYLAQPKQGGLTQEQIAERCGVARSTLYEWKRKPEFEAELKAEIVRRSHDRLPELIDSMARYAIEDGNAAMAKLVLEANRMLTKQTELSVNEAKAVSTEELEARLAKFKKDAKA